MLSQVKILLLQNEPIETGIELWLINKYSPPNLQIKFYFISGIEMFLVEELVGV